MASNHYKLIFSGYVVVLRAVIIDPLTSNTRTHRFYERLGFKFIQYRRFGDDECFVYRLTRTDWHHESEMSK